MHNENKLVRGLNEVIYKKLRFNLSVKVCRLLEMIKTFSFNRFNWKATKVNEKEEKEGLDVGRREGMKRAENMCYENIISFSAWKYKNKISFYYRILCMKNHEEWLYVENHFY